MGEREREKEFLHAFLCPLNRQNCSRPAKRAVQLTVALAMYHVSTETT